MNFEKKKFRNAMIFSLTLAIIIPISTSAFLFKPLASAQSDVSIKNITSLHRFRAQTVMPDTKIFDITHDGVVRTAKNFSGMYNNLFGYVTEVPHSLSFKYEDKVVYKSNWAPWQPPITKSYATRQYQTYTFEKYVNIPTNVIDRIELEPSQTLQYQQAEIGETTSTVSQTAEIGMSVAYSFNAKRGINLGLGISLNLIQLTGKVTAENAIGVDQSLYSTVSTTRTQTVRYTKQTSRTWNLDNSGNNERRVYQLNYRQKFKLYFTTEYGLRYTVTHNGTGTWGRDDEYHYISDLSHLDSVRTVFYLLPIDLPTLGFTAYHNSPDGSENAVSQEENNVIYL